MINFLRKFRLSLISQGKTGRYIQYALGELTLVVIGILIALQINNYNAARKAKEAEITFYKNAILDLKEESKSIATNIKWFKWYQDTYYLIYEESKGKKIDEPIPYANLIWNNFFRPVIDEKYGDNLDNLGNETVQGLFRDLIWREKLTIEAMNEWNDSKFNSVKPFFSKYEIANVDSIYSDKRYGFMDLKPSSYVDENRLRSRYGTKEFEQILYDGKYKSSWVLRCLDNLKVANQNLVIGLEAIVNDDLETLENIEPIDSYY